MSANCLTAPRWAAVAGLGVVAVLILRRSTRFEVQGQSMTPTLEPGDYVLATPLPQRLCRPRPGWIVVARRPDRPGLTVIKRVAAVDHGGGGLILLGDNPEGSSDSREFGSLARRHLLGVAWLRYWPPWRAGLLLGRAQRGKRDGGDGVRGQAGVSMI